MQAIVMLTEVIVIAIVGFIYFYIQDKKEAKRKAQEPQQK